MIIKFRDFANENFINPVRSDLKKFDGKLSHRVMVSSSGQSFNAYLSEDAETSKRVTRLYLGPHALDLGGYAPSHNDVWLGIGDCVLLIKTNKDDLIPDDVLLDAAKYLKGKSDVEGDVNMCLARNVRVFGDDIKIDPKNSGRISIEPGNTRIHR